MTLPGSTTGPVEAPLAEVTVPTTRLLRLALGVEESRCYWEHVDPATPADQRLLPAFEGRWFGAKSQGRVGDLLAVFRARYDAYPQALEVLRRWRGLQPETRRLLCHWHLQLVDPVYRAFSGGYLVERRSLPAARVDRDGVQRWVHQEHPGRWSEATTHTWGEKLIAAAFEAGLLSAGPGARTCRLPRVPDEALGYWLHLLREVRFAGTLTDNPYFASVGLTGGLLDQRLSALPGVGFRRMGELTEFEWSAPSLRDWAQELR